MTYDALENSAYGGKPVELYKFTMGTSIWRHTDGDRDVVIGAETYKSGWPISRTEPEISDETTRSALKITVAKDYPIAQLFIAGASWQALWVSVFRAHIGDLETVLIWQGKVRGVTWGADGDAIIECEPVETAFGKGGLRQNYGPYCCKRLYSPRCGVSESLFTTDFTVSAISTTGLVVTAPEFSSHPDHYFRQGEIYVPDLSARVLVVAHTGSTVTLRAPIRGLVVGASGKVLAGCDHIWRSAASSASVAALIAGGMTQAQANAQIPPDGHCLSRFNNLGNFIGFPYSPKNNPYTVGIEG